VILSVDPGVKHVGLALWDDGELQRAWLAKTELPAICQDISDHTSPLFLEEVVVERMQIYPGMRLRGDPNDLVSVTIVGAELVGMLRAGLRFPWPGMIATYVYPRSWKGNLKKNAHHPRIMAALSQEEISMIELPRAKALAHNIIDAVGLGLHKLGRMDRGKTRKTA
jgi:hypothetical protein